MKRIFFFLVCLSFIIQGCHVRTKGQMKLGDPVEITQSYSWDFGQRQEGEILKHTFTLKNRSKQTLTILEINTSCGCTISEVKDKVLMPRESTTIEVQFNSKGYSGGVQQFIYVHTDNVDNPILRFTIKAEVIKLKQGA